MHPPMAKLLVRLATAATALAGVTAFNPSTGSFVSPLDGLRTQTLGPTTRTRNSLRLQMCICIHCARVTNCSAYHFVEEQHSQPHINKFPTWEPRNGSPTIQVHIRPNSENNELEKMWDEHEDQTRQAEKAFANEDGEGGDLPLLGEKQYDLSGTTTYEYDVVECDDFVQDEDAWVRNMPEEIRIANPDFVPT
eukprot:CAMPEP_0172528526 /NCGR_PEP_ID=MMETSP1067-20121228/2901_1 /TAXON_ID=265564 ORGANISM="Thalassiosira punctigera, Strain Tpunct2005C2" /NCGR_SAMPLE_ID=MMETSP1067 /ASSEMBLY_ACC=CAM_ASM_000444 /LENGTH=192 /DNA_ID=CAMNT_0013312457 /DNA_START=93 /DNA_END=671 /DNA_ORIENTATION=+